MLAYRLLLAGAQDNAMAVKVAPGLLLRQALQLHHLPRFVCMRQSAQQHIYDTSIHRDTSVLLRLARIMWAAQVCFRPTSTVDPTS